MDLCSSCGNYNTFKLKTLLKNCVGGEKRTTVYNTKDARDEVNAIIAETGC